LRTLLAALVILLISSSVGCVLVIAPASANPEGYIPNLSMPKEYINYTIANVNGVLWAKIDGYYPIYLLKENNCSFNGELPMVYPMPPQTTNINISLDNQQVGYINYTRSYPEALHHTAIGNWWMIYFNLENVSDYFVLKIHYEHPLEKVNGSYLFLYDLNIDPYLSEQDNDSTAYFTIQMPTAFTNLNVYSTETDTKWNPIDYNLTEDGSSQVVGIQMHSEYGKPLLGDLVVTFSHESQIPELTLWSLPIITVGTILILCYWKNRSKDDRPGEKS
jgi:hypothetical protein